MQVWAKKLVGKAAGKSAIIKAEAGGYINFASVHHRVL
jgi:hypothetical protein